MLMKSISTSLNFSSNSKFRSVKKITWQKLNLFIFIKSINNTYKAISTYCLPEKKRARFWAIYISLNMDVSQGLAGLWSKLILYPGIMYFSENFHVVWISGVNVGPVFQIGSHEPVVVLKFKFKNHFYSWCWIIFS